MLATLSLAADPNHADAELSGGFYQPADVIVNQMGGFPALSETVRTIGIEIRVAEYMQCLTAEPGVFIGFFNLAFMEKLYLSPQ